MLTPQRVWQFPLFFCYVRDTDRRLPWITKRMKKVLTQTTLVLGGANSGKSQFSENLLKSMGQPLTYIATAQAWDDEMRGKISDHKTMRGPDW
ncbi:MAG: bifunctional adenosylcobinamide kinase/adenosylcobinamide-phosphate guanylyltransferase, partial [Pseudomonadota bacterium]